MIRKVAPSPGTARRPGRRAPLGAAAGGRRWQRVLQRIMAPVLIAGMLLPAFAFPVAGSGPALSVDPELARSASGQATDNQRGKSFEELSAEDLFSQPIYEVVKKEWDAAGLRPVPTGTEIVIPAANYLANGGNEGLQVVENFQGRPGATLLWTNDDEGWVEWEVNAPVTGLYQMTVEYYPIPGKRA